MNTNLNFEVIEVLDTKIMYLIDSSIYDIDSVLDTTLSLTFPNKIKEQTINIDVGQLNMLTTKHFFPKENVVDFCDGVYKVKLKSEDLECTYSKYVYRTTELLIKLDQALLEVDLFNKDLLMIYNKISLYLHGIKIYVNENQKMAEMMYKQIEKYITQLNCKY